MSAHLFYKFYTLFYFLLSVCLVYPPNEFISAGFTIENIFGYWLGSESEFFVQYHIRRSIVTLFVHCTLPFGYVLGLFIFGHTNFHDLIAGDTNLPWLIFMISSVLAPIFCSLVVLSWWSKNWSTHPIAKNLSVHRTGDATWASVASDVNVNFRRIDKVSINISSIAKVIVTDDWILKVTPYKLYAAHQNDSALILNKSDTHSMSHMTRGEVQYVNIEVKPTRIGAQPFSIRINSLDFQDIQDKVLRPIVVLQNVTFHRTLLDRFIDTFKEQVARNPRIDVAQELEQCIGCMQAPSNIKLTKLCGDITEVAGGPDACVSCQCRPMWCVDCMAKWFASRQDENSPETWLSSKCTCPVCRARFCLLDVCLIRTTS